MNAIKSLKHYLDKKLLRSHSPIKAILAGVGGTGSHIASGLARMHYSLLKLGHPGIDLIAFDSDNVSKANVGRQLFSEADVGRNKAQVIITRVNNFFGIDWKAYPETVTSGVLRSISNADLIISAVDSVKSRKIISKYARSTYWLDTGNTKDTGQVVLGSLKRISQPEKKGNESKLPTVIQLYRDMEKAESEGIQGPSCSVEDSLRRQDLFINQFVANAAVQLLWKGIRKGFLKYHGYIINLQSAAISMKPIAINHELWARMGYKRKRK